MVTCVGDTKLVVENNEVYGMDDDVDGVCVSRQKVDLYKYEDPKHAAGHNKAHPPMVKIE